MSKLSSLIINTGEIILFLIKDSSKGSLDGNCMKESSDERDETDRVVKGSNVCALASV